MHLIAAAATGLDPMVIVDYVVVIVEVALALGMVIFVHELGHFAVAKWCGVKCEKFYLGFDIYGLKLWKRQWGETEYGIGILPLGGYVKMLGQEDNPNRLAEEIERSKTGAAASTKAEVGSASAAEAQPALCPQEIAHAEAALHDPRSYLAKSVPQRMAIISAGVVMNLIFAYFCAMLAYGLGVDYTPSTVGGVAAGQHAWQAGLRPGDEIVQIGDVKNPRFKDLQIEVAFGAADGVTLELRRPGVEEPFSVTMVPDEKREKLMPKIGVAPMGTNELRRPRNSRDLAKPVAKDSAASRAEPPLAPGDRIVAVNGVPVTNSAEIELAEDRFASEPITLTVRRPDPPQEGTAEPEPKYTELEVRVPPQLVLRTGLVMEMGRITAVRQGSPADQAGLKAGDLITKIDGQPLGDPLTLPSRLHGRVGETVTLVIDRPSRESPLEVQVQLGEPPVHEWPRLAMEKMPVNVETLGIAYDVGNRIAAVEQDSPASRAGLVPGEEVASATIVLPKDASKAWQKTVEAQNPLEFDAKNPNWTYLFHILQQTPPGTRVKLAVSSGNGTPRTVELAPVEASDWFNPERGFNLEGVTATRQAKSVGQAAAFAYKETKDAVLQVYRFIRGLAEQKISPKLLGGPISIATVAGMSAFEGSAELLLFLTMLSANLAVVNFLPIPLLDGGHMVLLAWEGIRGKPASERVTIALQYVGLCFILCLMVFVFSLDAGRLMGLDWVMKR